ncbi:MAG TPA: hypothetical protein VK480_08960 [Solirubrobacterales bacterium]|nr:hypothetical protein [Solirubrobacterales bacterium]
MTAKNGTGRWGLLLLSAIAFLLPWGEGDRAAAAPAEVTEFDLSATDLYPGSIASGPDGNLWVAITRGQLGRPGFEQQYEGVAARISPAGLITEFPAPVPWFGALASGPGGNVWYLQEKEVGFISPAGSFNRLTPTPSSVGGLAAGPDGNVWVTERNDPGTDAVLRVTPAGEVTRFPLPHRESGPSAITLGPDGALWFTETFGDRIGRITTSGGLREFPVPSRPVGITTGPDGNIWFTYWRGVGRMTLSGKVSEFPLRQPKTDAVEWMLGPIVTGPDGRLWFPNGVGRIGRISPSGRMTQVDLPFGGSFPVDVTLGPDGALWYSAWGDSPCVGGSSCQRYVPRRGGLVGRIVPGDLAVSIASARAAVVRGRAKIRLRCQEGDASSVCGGAIRLKRGAVTVGRAGYRVPTDTRRAVMLRLTRKGRALLSHRHRLPVTATATLRSGESDRRSIVLVRHRDR